MSMSISSASGASSIAAPRGATQSPERQAFGQLTKAIKAGDLEGAKTAFESMVKNAPDGASWNPDSAFAQLGKAIQSGNVDAAKSAYMSMVKSRGERPPVETANPIAADTASSSGAGSLVNLTA
jgi:TolA-binding protein